jgi:nucleotide-binding universal stress UspA family protein
VHRHQEIYERHVTEHLERALSQSARARLSRQFHIVRGRADDQILQMASYTDADVIVMGVGRGTDPTFGSTVNHVVRNATCPVLTVRGDAESLARAHDESLQHSQAEHVGRAMTRLRWA